jgi:type IV pilus assembly protein PilO
VKASKQNVIIWSLLAVICLVLIGNYVLGKQSSIDSQAASVRSQTATVQTQTQAAEAIRAEFPKVKAEIAALQGQVPTTSDLSGLISQLASTAAASGVTLVSAAPDTKNDVSQNGITAVPVNIAVNGTFAAAQQFTSALVHATRITTIGGLTYQFSTTGTLTVQIQADLYYRS